MRWRIEREFGAPSESGGSISGWLDKDEVIDDAHA